MKSEYSVRIKDEDGEDRTIQVIFEEEVIFEWYDLANVDFPEDLCWSREISQVFDAGVALGKRIASKKSGQTSVEWLLIATVIVSVAFVIFSKL